MSSRASGSAAARGVGDALARPNLALALLLAAAALLLCAGLGNRDFWSPDEPRYGAIAEELRSFRYGWQGLLLLHLNGEPYTQKPPLYFWLAALAGAAGGRVGEVAARLPSALAGFGTLLLVAWLGRSMFRPRAGLLAAAVLLGVPSWLQLAVSARLDALLSAEITLAFVAAWRIDRQIGALRANQWLLHAAIGLGILTKGPVALLLPALGLLAYLGWERRLGALRRFATPACALLSIAPGLAWWAGAAALAPTGYTDASLWDNLIGRFFSGTSHAEPVWFYLAKLPRGFLPWTLLWPAAWWQYRRLSRTDPGGAQARAWRFLLAAVGAAVVFLSLSAGKRAVYLLPTYPLLAIVCGETLAVWVAGSERAARWLRSSVLLAGAALGAAALASLVLPRFRGTELPAAFGLLLAGGLGVAWWLARTLRASAGERVALLAAGLCGIFSLLLAVEIAIVPTLNVRNSSRPLAEIAHAAAPPGATIAVYRNDTLAAAIGYYARRESRELREPREVAAFFAEGGRVLVVQERYVAALSAALPLQEVARGMRGKRRFLVMMPPG